MTFRDLHQPGTPFILANAWDAGSAKMLARLGAPAIATSSAVAAVTVPVSGDFENGFGHDPDTCAETVRLSAEAGLAGISIEDAALPEDRAYDFAEAVERIRAAAAAARALPHDFILVARADGVMNGHYDIDEALRRIIAFDEAGADCLYVPLPKTMDDLRRVIAATTKPVNVLVAGPYAAHSVEFYAAMGAARLSLGSALARVTHKAIFDAAEAMFGAGDFTLLATGMKGADVDSLLT